MLTRSYQFKWLKYWLWTPPQTRNFTGLSPSCERGIRLVFSNTSCWVTTHEFATNIYKHVYACGPKTVPVKRTILNIAIVEWSGVGGHVNVPCTSYMIYCHAAEISGIVYYSELETGSLVPNFYHGSAVWLKGPKAKCQRGHVITWLYKIYIRQVKLTLNLFFKDHMMLVKKVGSKASSVHDKCTPSRRG